METHADLVKGRLGAARAEDGSTSTAAANEPTSYRASRLGLSPGLGDPSGSVRPRRSRSERVRKMRAVRRSARLGWTAAAALVIACGIGSYFLTARIVGSFSRKLERLASHVRQQVAAITKLEAERERLRRHVTAARADLVAEKSRTVKTTAQLEATVDRLMDVIKERDRARAELNSEQAKTATITAQLESSLAKLVVAMRERDKARQTLSAEQAKASKIAAQLEASVAKLVDAMGQRDRARDRANQALIDASRAQVRLELLEKRLRDLSEQSDRLKKAVNVNGKATTEPAMQSLVLDRMISQFKEDLMRVKKAMQIKAQPAETPARKTQ